ncbi:MAG TPA: YetF domain-containing protein [Candidatus Dormibacteraeota bacterium]|nr:YetF domain-containing protein [Candidatus Dormibacteraeota bacterium]
MSGAVFDLSNPLLNIVARTAIIYLALLVGLRLTGKRQVGQFTPFDLLLLLLLSNAVQNAMVGPDTSVAGGLIAAGTLFAANGIVAMVARRSRRAAKVVEGTATLLIRHGQVLQGNLDREGISEEDLRRALREHGIDDVKLVRAAILEVDGSISVLREDEFPKVERPYHHIRGLKRKA